MRRNTVQDSPDAPFVGGICEGMQEADRNGLHVVGQKGEGKTFNLDVTGSIQRYTAVIDPLVYLEAQRTRHHRVGVLSSQVVDIIAKFAADLDDIAEAGSGDQRGNCALALDNQVADRGRRTCYNLRYLSGRNFMLCKHAPQASDNWLGDIAGSE